MNLNENSKAGQKLEAFRSTVQEQADAAKARFEAAGFTATFVDRNGNSNLFVLTIKKGEYYASIDFWLGYPGGRFYCEPGLEVRPSIPYGVLPRSPSRIKGTKLPQDRFDRMVTTLIEAYEVWNAKNTRLNQARNDTASGQQALDARLKAEGLKKSVAWISPNTGGLAGTYDYQAKFYSLTLDQVVALEKTLATFKK